MTTEPEHRPYVNGTALSENLAADVAAALQRRLAAGGMASLVVSGGRTPLPFFECLRAQPLDWSRVAVTLADERCVPADDAGSNGRMVREVLLRQAAAAARFVAPDTQVEDPVAAWERQLAAMPHPWSAVVLGMGEVGDFASLFPGMPGLEQALALDGRAGVVEALAPTEPRRRLSQTLAALLDTDWLALHVTGVAKLATLQRAQGIGLPQQLPVRALLRQRRVPLHVYHSP